MVDTGPAQPTFFAGKQGGSSIGDADSDAASTGTHWNSTKSTDLLTRLAGADRLAVVELAERLARAIRNGLAVSG
jgi:hypothetical protein